MNGTLLLQNPILVNGQSVTEVAYDANEITAAMFAQADAGKHRAGGRGITLGSMAAETDSALHLYLGLMAILAVNPGLDLRDLERLKGPDVVTVMRIGRNFMVAGSAAPSSQNDSAVPSGTMPGPSTPPSQTWGENG